MAGFTATMLGPLLYLRVNSRFDKKAADPAVELTDCSDDGTDINGGADPTNHGTGPAAGVGGRSKKWNEERTDEGPGVLFKGDSAAHSVRWTELLLLMQACVQLLSGGRETHDLIRRNESQKKEEGGREEREERASACCCASSSSCGVDARMIASTTSSPPGGRLLCYYNGR